MMKFIYKLGSPKWCYQISKKISPWLAWICAVLFAYGLIGGLVLAPADYQQGDGFRIIYLHVPSAFMSLLVYGVMSFCALLTIVWRIKLSYTVIQISAPIGMWFTFLALVTGAIWGKPMWGTWWIWDARLTSELILLFIYLAILILQSALSNKNKGEQAVALFILLGFIDIPLIHYSVNWWHTLHQGASLSKFAKPSIAASMLYPLLTMIAAFFSYYLWLLAYRLHGELKCQHS